MSPVCWGGPRVAKMDSGPWRGWEQGNGCVTGVLSSPGMRGKGINSSLKREIKRQAHIYIFTECRWASCALPESMTHVWGMKPDDDEQEVDKDTNNMKNNKNTIIKKNKKRKHKLIVHTFFFLSFFSSSSFFISYCSFFPSCPSFSITPVPFL